MSHPRPCFSESLPLLFILVSFVSVREIMDIVKGEWGTFETTNVDQTELQTNTQTRMARGERSREILRDLIVGAFAGDRSGYRWGKSDDSGPPRADPDGLEGSRPEVREIHGMSPAAKGIHRFAIQVMPIMI